MELNAPQTVTTSCPAKEFRQRYIMVGCINCEHFKGTALLTSADEMDIKDHVTGKFKGKRPIQWQEKHVIRCAYPMTRRCSDISIVED